METSMMTSFKAQVQIQNKHKQNKAEIYNKLKDYVKSFSQEINNLDDNQLYLSQNTDIKSCSTVLHDLLLEEDSTVIRKKYIPEKYMDCYRCYHFRDEPKKLLNLPFEKSSFLVPYKSEITFVQAIVWLKSVTLSAKTIPVKKLHEVTELLEELNSDTLNCGPNEVFHQKMLKDDLLINDSPEVTSGSSLRVIIPETPSDTCSSLKEEEPKERDSAYGTLMDTLNCDILQIRNDDSLNFSSSCKSMLSPRKLVSKEEKAVKCVITGIYDVTRENIIQSTISKFISSASINHQSFINDGKKLSRKSDPSFDTSYCAEYFAKNKKRKVFRDEYASAEYINFLLQSPNAYDVAFQSVKMILNVLMSEGTARQYMKWKRWKNTLEQEAVEAVLNFSDVFNMEEQNTVTNICVATIIKTIKGVFDEMININELNEIPFWEYRIHIILELCNSMTICVNVIDYLIMKLPHLVNHIAKLYADYSYIPKIQLLFSALFIVMQKFYTVITKYREENPEARVFSEKTNCWRNKSTLHYCEIQEVQETVEEKMERWLDTLENFTKSCLEYDPRFADKSRQIFCTLAAM